jgi:hypothetical protein
VTISLMPSWDEPMSFAPEHPETTPKLEVHNHQVIVLSPTSEALSLLRSREGETCCRTVLGSQTEVSSTSSSAPFPLLEGTRQDTKLLYTTFEDGDSVLSTYVLHSYTEF